MNRLPLLLRPLDLCCIVVCLLLLVLVPELDDIDKRDPDRAPL